MQRLVLLTLLLIVGCGNPGGLSDLEYTAKLRNKREAYEKKQKEANAAAEWAIQNEQLRQKNR